MKQLLTFLLFFLTLNLSAAERPNIILVMVDDMGFSDLGYHGGEINTPNIDALAHGGVRFSQFYNSGRCCPTRATLLTGNHPHQTGIGHMTQPPLSDRGKNRPPAYQGYLNRECVTIAETLKNNGYATLMSGKWHLGNNDVSRWPLQRGFDKYFGCISGATRFFYPEEPRGMTFGNEKIAKPKSTTDEAFYTTDAYTDYAIRFMTEHQAERAGKPFFLYLAYTAPHWPLQAFEEDIAKYRGKYTEGWDALRKTRFQRQLDSGLIKTGTKLSPRTPSIPDWESLDAKKRDEMDLKMAVYAAMVDRVDQNIGKLVSQLKKSKTFDNTLILFLSDNGGCQEGGMLGRGNFYDIEKRNLESGNSYGEAWANASNTPFRLYKHFAHEGGTATPFFMHWPAKIEPRKDWFRKQAQLIDVMPTLLDVAGATHPKRFNDNQIYPLDGISLRPAFNGNALKRSEPIFVEHEDNAFVRDGDWKLVGRKVSPAGGVVPAKWELYNIAKDRTETSDLAPTEPERVKKMASQWNAWAKRAKVFPKNGPNTPVEPQEEAITPQVGQIPFTLKATIQLKSPKGVVMAQGGVAFGYALYFEKGKPVFAYRSNKKLKLFKGKKKLSGKIDIVVEVDKETITMTANGNNVASGKSGGLILEQPGLGLYIGSDGVHPVGEYEVPNTFNGTIVSHSVTSEKPKVSMRTPWGEKVTADNVWQEYPRPALKRSNWTNLNGNWNYAITKKGAIKAPKKWAGKILVPFAIEAPLSGVERPFTPSDALWYQRNIQASLKAGKRHILNFEAVDYQSTIWVNGTKIGSHTGGNLPFSFDITNALKEGANELTLKVTDSTDAKGAYQLHGKQRLNPKGIWYTPVSGIWQTVWIEEVPETHISDIKVITKMDGNISIAVSANGSAAGRKIAKVTVSLKGKEIVTGIAKKGKLQLKINNPKLWSPDSPTLYDLRIQLGSDVVESYVGIREVGKRKDAKGHWRFTLNGKDIFHWGPLDQGWWPDGLLTPPSDEAMRSDIDWLKAAGFNMIRKHIKVEPRRYYTYCDQVGMMVWQDQVSSMSDNPKWTRIEPNPETRTWPKPAHKQFMTELKQMIDTLHNHPSIVQWVPFNERWGQHQTVEVGDWTSAYDPTRHVNVASGGNWFPSGDIVDQHKYPHPGFPFETGPNKRFEDYIKVMGEFGGHGFPVEGHVYDPGKRNWGYGGLPKDKTEWIERYKESLRILVELKEQGIAAGVYTQTTDVEGEINGLITYDRKVQKISADQLADWHKVLEK
ncbi:sulfatase-like hydrolase/transferase [Verrucomicrobia bacterium]|nr:sulfatase-like hydrolase/transferase [Verrucomicrobiota bacterium]MDB4459268.1 sulfatase-like hydrolase/transferase [bacterium]